MWLVYVNHIDDQTKFYCSIAFARQYMSRFSESSIVLFDCIGLLSSKLILDKKI